jgi:ABC-2 type transport system ATP-binding protein
VIGAMIGIDGLRKTFGTLVAVDGVNLSVGKGEVLGFLGPNGAGKTTTMRMLAGFLEPTAGDARICGFSVTGQPVEVKRRLGYLPEGAPLYGEMTPRAFLSFVAGLRGLRGSERRQLLDRVFEDVAIADVLDQPIETLSKGYKRRVGLAQAIVHEPPVLILDEPTDGLDPNQKHHVRQLIRQMAPDKAIIVSTHILEEVEQVCTRAVIIAQGRIVADGTAAALLDRLPRHNAVVVSVPRAEADAAARALGRAASPAGIECGEEIDGLVRFFVLGHGGRARLAEVARELHADGITVESLAVERGRLEDVFRRVTHGADGGEEA